MISGLWTHFTEACEIINTLFIPIVLGTIRWYRIVESKHN